MDSYLEQGHRQLFKMFKKLSRDGIDEMFTMDEYKKGTRVQCLKLLKNSVH